MLPTTTSSATREAKARRKAAARRKRQRARDRRNPRVKVQRAGHLKGQRLVVLRQNANRCILRLHRAAIVHGATRRARRSFRAKARAINRAVAGLRGWGV